MVRTEALYWKVDQPVHYSWENFPTFIHYTEHEDPYQHFYGLPISEYPGLVKVNVCTCAENRLGWLAACSLHL